MQPQKFRALQVVPSIAKEEEPGPLLIQGDHGPIDYRNIIITPAK